MDYELRRSVSDIQSKISSLDHKVLRMSAGAPAGSRPPRPGQQLILKAAAQLARVSGNAFLFDALEQKSATAPAMTGVATWAAELAIASFPGLVLSLERQSAMAAILTKSPQVSLLGVGASKVPVAGVAPPAKIVAEGAGIPVLKGSFAPLDLVPFKVAAIMGFSKELAEVSTIEASVRSMLGQSVAAGMDNIAFGTTPPGGLLAGVTPITASTATPLETAMRQDLQNLIAALTAPSSDLVFVMSPSRAVFASSVLPSSFMYSIVASSALPAATVVAVDAAGVAAALSAEAAITVSENAAVHEEDTTVLALASGAQGSGVVAVPMRAAFQTDTALLRIVAHASWSARVGSVAAITAVSW